MARKKSEFLSTLGVMFEIWKAIIEAVIARGGTDDDLRRIISDRDLAGKLADLIVAKIVKQDDPIFKVTVDYSLTLEQMIQAGRYVVVNDDITAERFPIQGEGKVERELVLVRLDELASTDEVLAELNRRGLRPAKINELLALGASRPELQKEFPIVALGSRWVRSYDSRSFAYLDWHDDGRYLDLTWGDDAWREDCRFLAARKSA